MRIPSWVTDLTPEKIAILYGGFGLVWISLSDYAVLRLLRSETTLSAIQTFKGSVFVVLSTVLIYGLTSHRENQLVASRDNLEKTSQRLQVLQRVFRHNIRNDMNVIKGYVDLVRDDVDSKTAKRQLTIASLTADDVITISEKLQVVDRYEITSRVDGEIDLAQVVSDEVDDFRTQHPRASIEVDSPDELVIHGDRSVHEIVSELLENAVRHFDEQMKTLHIEVRVVGENGRATITIVDNGPGIPPSELSTIREGHESKLIHSSSVGLWVVHWLCERLDAEISIDSTLGDGTVVTIDFPRPTTFPSVTG